jgi:hypothetical protein
VVVVRASQILADARGRHPYSWPLCARVLSRTILVDDIVTRGRCTSESYLDRYLWATSPTWDVVGVRTSPSLTDTRGRHRLRCCRFLCGMFLLTRNRISSIVRYASALSGTRGRHRYSWSLCGRGRRPCPCSSCYTRTNRT